MTTLLCSPKMGGRLCTKSAVISKHSPDMVENMLDLKSKSFWSIETTFVFNTKRLKYRNTSSMMQKKTSTFKTGETNSFKR